MRMCVTIEAFSAVIQMSVMMKVRFSQEDSMDFKGPVGCSTNCYHGFDLDRALRGIAESGFKHVELTAVKDYTEHVAPERMTGRDTRDLMQKLRGHGLVAKVPASRLYRVTERGHRVMGLAIRFRLLDFPQALAA